MDNPLGRLSLDGAGSPANIRRRLEWLAREWKIPASTLPKIDRCVTNEFMDFIEKHQISYNWLYRGTLADLRIMLMAHDAETKEWTAFLKGSIQSALNAIPTHVRRNVMSAVKLS